MTRSSAIRPVTVLVAGRFFVSASLGKVSGEQTGEQTLKRPPRLCRSEARRMSKVEQRVNKVLSLAPEKCLVGVGFLPL